MKPCSKIKVLFAAAGFFVVHGQCVAGIGDVHKMAARPRKFSRHRQLGRGLHGHQERPITRATSSTTDTTNKIRQIRRQTMNKLCDKSCANSVAIRNEAVRR